MRAWGDWSPGLRAVVAVTATTLFMVLVAWATLIGPDEVFTGAGPQPAATTSTDTCIPLPEVTRADGTTEVVIPDDYAARPYCEPLGLSNGEPGDVVEEAPPLWVAVLTWVLLGAAAAGAVVVMLALLKVVVRELRVRRVPDGDRAAIEFTVLDEAIRVAQEVSADAADQDTLLREGDPRNAIVAAWHRFELQGARAGVVRRASETSSEYGLRILELAEADAGSVNRLAELYREARFSEHAITEEHRTQALAALADIRHSLGAPA